MLTQKEVCDYFDYVDGILYWKVQKANAIKIGQAAGSLDERTGYYRIHINSKMYKTHRLIFLYHHGYLPNYVDHIDNNRTNNRIENLRFTCSNCDSQLETYKNRRGSKK